MLSDGPIELDDAIADLTAGDRFVEAFGPGPSERVVARGGMPVTAIVIPTPLSVEGLAAATASSPPFPGAEQAVRSHDAHAFVIARPADEGFEPLRDASLAASEVAAALGGTAVYWPAAGAPRRRAPSRTRSRRL